MPDPARRSVAVRRTRPLETRWPCPVCVGAIMDKIELEGEGNVLTLDHCPRCGGLWFERGEVGQLAARKASSLRPHVPERAERVRAQCIECHTPIDRDAEACEACGRRNALNCPVCDEVMDRRAHAGLILDFCKRCHGVWFDNAELSAIWRVNLAAASANVSRRRGRGADAVAATGDVLLEAMFWSPSLVLHAGVAVGQAAGSVAGVAGEVVGDAAEGVFSTIMEIIAGLFDGL
jgi:Zn-finger nucleic acid-binding protein